ncbi:MAG: hypothetical protein HY355_07770 [Armatimonadetes bacterium]|nr:hypothetical protein [Armatimonadota bacterium]
MFDPDPAAVRVLFVSNGYGEDLIAAEIIRYLPGVAVTAYPLVGTGAYPPQVPLLDPRRAMPSAGFSFRAGLRGLGADLAAGIIGLWFAQRRTLARQRGGYHLVVAVGDWYCLWMAGLASPRVAFVSTAESVRITPFGFLAKVGLRRFARRVFARDPETAEALAAQGIPAVATGNVMMDLVRPAGERFPVPPEAPVVTLLPGSRQDAVENAALLARAADAIAAEVPQVRFLMALAPTVPAGSVVERLKTLGRALGPDERSFAIGGAHMVLTTAFADAVERAAMVMGFAGTAHEQAAGLGRPVVACPGPGTQFGPEFLKTQHRLLGDALMRARGWQEASAAAVRLLRDPDERQRRGAVGRSRMGLPGGARRIAEALLEILREDARAA